MNIFTNEEEVVRGIKESAAALGIDSGAMSATPQMRYYANKNCTKCFGRGVYTLCLSPCKHKVLWKKESAVGRRSVRKGSNGINTRARRKLAYASLDGNDLGWQTRQPEPYDFKQMNTTSVFCKCVRGMEE